MLSGVAPSWSRRRLLRARFLLACRLEAGGGEFPGLLSHFPGICCGCGSPCGYREKKSGPASGPVCASCRLLWVGGRASLSPCRGEGFVTALANGHETPNHRALLKARPSPA